MGAGERGAKSMKASTSKISVHGGTNMTGANWDADGFRGTLVDPTLLPILLYM